MKKNVIILVVVTGLTILSGFMRELVLAYFYGASMVSDAYIVSLTIPQTIFSFVGVGIATTFIPIYSSIVTEDPSSVDKRLTSNLINIMMILSIIFMSITLLFTELFVKIFASGFDGTTLQLAVSFTKISVLGVFFTSITLVLSSYLQAKERFLYTGSMSVPLNIVNIVAIYLGYVYNIYWIVIGSVLAFAAQLLYLSYDVKRSKFKYHFFINIKDPAIKQIIILSLPTILGSSVSQINTLIDSTLASRVALGGISILSYSGRITAMIYSISVVPIAVAVFPILSKQIAANYQIGFKALIEKSINTISLIVIPASVGLILFSTEIIRLLYGRGQFDEASIQMTSSVLKFYAIGIVGSALREVLYRASFAMKDTKTPAINSVIALITNIVLNLILSRFMGLNGLALATSIAELLTATLQFRTLYLRVEDLNYRLILSSVVKIVSASILMGYFARGAYIILVMNINPTLALILSILIGVIVYSASIYLAKVREFVQLIEWLRLRIGFS